MACLTVYKLLIVLKAADAATKRSNPFEYVQSPPRVMGAFLSSQYDANTDYEEASSPHFALNTPPLDSAPSGDPSASPLWLLRTPSLDFESLSADQSPSSGDASVAFAGASAAPPDWNSWLVSTAAPQQDLCPAFTSASRHPKENMKDIPHGELLPCLEWNDTIPSHQTAQPALHECTETLPEDPWDLQALFEQEKLEQERLEFDRKMAASRKLEAGAVAKVKNDGTGITTTATTSSDVSSSSSSSPSPATTSKDVPMTLAPADDLISPLMIETFREATQLWKGENEAYPRRIPKRCCEMARALAKTFGDHDIVVFAAFLGRLVEKLGARDVPFETVKEETLRLFRLTMYWAPRRNAKNVAYLLASMLSETSSEEHVAEVQDALREGCDMVKYLALPKDKWDVEDLEEKAVVGRVLTKIPTIIPKEDGNYKDAAAFFDGTTTFQCRPKCVYPHIINLFRSKEVRGLIDAAFAKGCRNSSAHMAHFKALYDAFFNPALHLEVTHMRLDAMEVGSDFPDPMLRDGRVGAPHHFFTRVWLPRLVGNLHNTILTTRELFGQPALIDTLYQVKSHYVQGLRPYVVTYPTAETMLRHSREAGHVLRALLKCFLELEERKKDSATTFAAKYKMFNITYETLKISHCIVVVLSLVQVPENWRQAIRALEDALRQMAFHNVDPSAVERLVGALWTRLEGRQSV